MGLDMYLHKKTYVKNWEHMSESERHSFVISKGGIPVTNIKSERICYIEEEVGYWRKANAIHNWFVQNCQDGVDNCQISYVDEEKLEELLDVCKKVLDNHDLAEELLPTTSGFFFGSTNYDEWYFKDIEDTVKILEDIFKDKIESKNTPGKFYLNGDYYYQSSW